MLHMKPNCRIGFHRDLSYDMVPLVPNWFPMFVKLRSCCEAIFLAYGNTWVGASGSSSRCPLAPFDVSGRWTCPKCDALRNWHDFCGCSSAVHGSTSNRKSPDSKNSIVQRVNLVNTIWEEATVNNRHAKAIKFAYHHWCMMRACRQDNPKVHHSTSFKIKLFNSYFITGHFHLDRICFCLILYVHCCYFLFRLRFASAFVLVKRSNRTCFTLSESEIHFASCSRQSHRTCHCRMFEAWSPSAAGWLVAWNESNEHIYINRFK